MIRSPVATLNPVARDRDGLGWLSLAVEMTSLWGDLVRNNPTALIQKCGSRQKFAPKVPSRSRLLLPPTTPLDLFQGDGVPVSGQVRARAGAGSRASPGC